jgi:hypothetical protein
MEIRIENFTPTGNNLKWRQPFQNFEKEKCMSRSKYITRNREYYNRMLYTLTDNRSIDVLNKMSMSGTSKISQKEFVSLYINSVKGKLSVPEMVQALMVVYPEQESPDGARFLFGLVMRELKEIGNSNLAETIHRITVNIDGEPVEIEAGAQGVLAINNFVEIGDDEIFPTPTRTEDGIVRFTDPAQMSVPRDLPEPIPRIIYSRLGIPSNNELFTQTENYYPNLEQRITGGTRGTVGQFATGRIAGGSPERPNREIQTVLSGEYGRTTPPRSRSGGSSNQDTETVRTSETGGMSVLQSSRTSRMSTAREALRKPDTTQSGVSIIRPARTLEDMARQRVDEVFKDFDN